MVNTARSRIHRLRYLAQKVDLEGQEDLAKRYLTLARKIGMRYNIKVKDKTIRCRKCASPLLDGGQVQVRVKRGRIIRHCLNCGDTYRIPIRGKKGGQPNKEEA